MTDTTKSITITLACDKDNANGELVFIPFGEPVTKVLDMDKPNKEDK